MRKKAEEEKKKVINQLLAAEGLELDTDDDGDDALQRMMQILATLHISYYMFEANQYIPLFVEKLIVHMI